jgi:hypothetical protein
MLYINDPTRIKNETEFDSEKVKSGDYKIKDTDKSVYRKYPFILLKTPKKYVPLNAVIGTGKSLEHRIVVRGHWRNQACGEHYSEHKMIWKGPEIAEIVNKPYLVGDQ